MTENKVHFVELVKVVAYTTDSMTILIKGKRYVYAHVPGSMDELNRKIDWCIKNNNGQELRKIIMSLVPYQVYPEKKKAGSWYRGIKKED